MKSGTFWLRHRTPRGGSGKYIRFGLRIDTGAERTTIFIIIIQQVRDTGIHLKVSLLVDREPKSSGGPQKRNERQVGGERTHTCRKAIPLACPITPTLV